MSTSAAAINVIDSNLKSSSRRRNVEKSGDDYPTPKLSPKRKKSSSKNERFGLKRVVSVLIKNGIFFSTVFIVTRAIWEWYNTPIRANQTLFAPPLVDRISDVKRATEVLQNQLRIVEDKIEREISGAKEQLGKIFREREEEFEKRFAELKARGDFVESSLMKLTGKNFLTIEELPRILEELKISSGTDGGESRRLNFDEIRKQVKDMIMSEVEKHAADGMGMVDFALSSGGGLVVRHSEPFNSGIGRWVFVGRAFQGRNVHHDAQKMLRPSFGEPGQCFALRGNTGFVEIKLRTTIILEAVTLEHVAKSVGYDRSSAPKECRISAWYTRDGDETSTTTTAMTVAEFMYDLDKMNVQTVGIQSSMVGVVNTVRLEFLSNHGNAGHTCLYRLRVHGRVPDP